MHLTSLSSSLVALLAQGGGADGAAPAGGSGDAAPPEFQPSFIEKILFGEGSSFILMIGMFIAVFYFLMIRPERKRMKQRESMLGALQKGNTVVTYGGIVGKIFRVEEREVIIVVDKDSNVKMRFLRNAVNEVIPETKTVEKQT